MATTTASAALAERRAGTPAAAVVALLGGGAVLTALTIWAVWASPLVLSPETTAVVKGLQVASYIAVGAYTWWRRPRSRLGPLVAVAGFLAVVTALAASTRPFLFTLGRFSVAVLTAYFLYLFLCFPRDRLHSRFERRFLIVFAAATGIAWLLVLTISRTLPRGGAFTDCTQNCPANPLRVVDSSHTLTQSINLLANGVVAAGAVLAIVLLVRKATSPAHLRRRAVVPLLLAAVLFAASYAAYSTLTQANADPNITVLRILSAIGALSIPLALLVGQVRGRIFAATNLWRLLARAGGRRLTPLWVEGILANSLGDPSFALALWDPERNGYVDSSGEPTELPRPTEARAVTVIPQQNRPGIALLHDPSLNDEPELVEGLGATAVMLLENARLVDELQASRARIVESAERERLRLERDLHDGAQQRLMAIQVKLAIARDGASGEELAGQLDELAENASAAVEELRALAHGIYPTVLRERGLAAALQAFARMSPARLEVDDRNVGRAPAAVEAAIYFCTLEAVQNASKHAGAGADIAVTLERAARRIDFEVRDDGVGFDPAARGDGFGLVSMQDRIAAVGGELSLRSSPGHGTVVSGSVPVAA